LTYLKEEKSPTGGEEGKERGKKASVRDPFAISRRERRTCSALSTERKKGLRQDEKNVRKKIFSVRVLFAEKKGDTFTKGEKKKKRTTNLEEGKEEEHSEKKKGMNRSRNHCRTKEEKAWEKGDKKGAEPFAACTRKKSERVVAEGHLSKKKKGVLKGKKKDLLS